MTEEQARLQQCCGGEGCGYVNDGVRYCVASTCMAWRWLGAETLNLKPEETPAGDGWVKGAMWSDGRYRTWERRGFSGYCGLAGKP